MISSSTYAIQVEDLDDEEREGARIVLAPFRKPPGADAVAVLVPEQKFVPGPKAKVGPAVRVQRDVPLDAGQAKWNIEPKPVRRGGRCSSSSSAAEPRHAARAVEGRRGDKVRYPRVRQSRVGHQRGELRAVRGAHHLCPAWLRHFLLLFFVGLIFFVLLYLVQAQPQSTSLAKKRWLNYHQTHQNRKERRASKTSCKILFFKKTFF
jgi:hypothetical protein